MTTTAQQSIRIGHSPDPDDAFMFYALTHGKVPLEGIRVEHLLEDIESLNRRAQSGELEMTAASAAALPYLNNRYWILACGSSVGRGYGPIVVTREIAPAKDLRRKRIAVPGEYTTATLLLRLALDNNFEPVPMSFDTIMHAVDDQEVDAGLLIHEGQITYRDKGFFCALDLGVWWQEQTGLQAVPLGLDLVRADVGETMARRLNQALKESIAYARANEPEALEYALRYGRGIDAGVGSDFVTMYVNEDTLDLGEEGEAALNKLYDLAVEKGIWKEKPEIKIIR
ncbi:MAG: ABC transporter substrate-binding protein [Candidatus Omnitrophica bacterium]|nr:ABC transporter substrate-binding protein [Candidatus Omnitrophota bacterium]